MASDVKKMARNGEGDARRARRWLEQIAAPATRVDVDLLGLPGRLRVPPDWNVSAGPQGNDLFYFVVEGSFQAVIRQTEVEVAAGDLLWIGAGHAFGFRRPGDSPLLVLRFRLCLTAVGKPVAAPKPWRHVKGATSAARWMEQIIDEATVSRPWREARLRGLALALGTEVLRAEPAGEHTRGFLHRVQCAALEKRVQASPAGRPSVAELAKAAGLSTDYFARCFRRTFAQSPRRWLVEQRVRRAALCLLESDRRVGEIAAEFGYADAFTFSRQFRDVMGESPRRYRERRAMA